MNTRHFFYMQLLFWCLLGIATIGTADEVKLAPVAPVQPPSVATSSNHKASMIAENKVEPSLEDKLQVDWGFTVARIDSLEKTIAKTSERTNWINERAPLYALATVLISGLISIGAQVLLMRHQRNINREQAKSEVSNSYVEWQLKQLSEFYGPLRALLGQSNSMYRQMNKVLAAADPNQFRFQSAQGKDFDNKEFQIYKDGEWTRFRTVKHLSEVYNKNYGVEPYFDDVVNVGSRMASLIRDKAGYARPEDKKLIDVMGEYLAHFQVLSRLHDRAKNSTQVSVAKADEEATFPIDIQKLVNDGFESINHQVMTWRSQ